MIPANAVFFHTGSRPSRLAISVPMSMSDPSGLCPGPYDSSGGVEMSVQNCSLSSATSPEAGIDATVDDPDFEPDADEPADESPESEPQAARVVAEASRQASTAARRAPRRRARGDCVSTIVPSSLG